MITHAISNSQNTLISGFAVVVGKTTDVKLHNTARGTDCSLYYFRSMYVREFVATEQFGLQQRADSPKRGSHMPDTNVQWATAERRCSFPKCAPSGITCSLGHLVSLVISWKHTTSQVVRFVTGHCKTECTFSRKIIFFQATSTLHKQAMDKKKKKNEVINIIFRRVEFYRLECMHEVDKYAYLYCFHQSTRWTAWSCFNLFPTPSSQLCLQSNDWKKPYTNLCNLKYNLSLCEWRGHFLIMITVKV